MTKILFAGSNWEALSTLKVLDSDDRFELVALITQPDKPVGRKREVVVSDIKQYALDNNIAVMHTENKRSLYRLAIEKFAPDLIVCKSFGEMLPRSFIDAPKHGAINVHYSLLPKYRGAVPIQKAILEGDEVTGITYVKMVKQLDAGPILKKVKEKILPDDTNQSLRERLVRITGETIGDVIEEWVTGKIALENQDDTKATYCQQSDISKENAYIDLQKDDPIKIERMVRAMLPWPVVWTLIDDKRLKIFETELVIGRKLEPGEFGFDGEDLFVGTSDSKKMIKLKNIQLEGKTIMTGKQFALGKNYKEI